MKKINIVTYGLCLIISLVMLVGCTTKDTSFTSNDGIAVASTTQWKQVSDKEDLKAFYTNDLADSEMTSLDLAIQSDDSLLFTIEKYDCSEDYQYIQEFHSELRDLVADFGENEVVKLLTSSKYTPSEIALFQEAWQVELLSGDLGDNFYRQVTDLSWLNHLEATEQDYQLLSHENIALLGKPSTLYEYQYKNVQGALLHFYEATVKLDNQFYTISAWSEDSTFTKHKEILRTMITTVTTTDTSGE